MKIKLLPNGKLLVPCSVISIDGVIGDSVEEIEKDTPEYNLWLKHLDENQQTAP